MNIHLKERFWMYEKKKWAVAAALIFCLGLSGCVYLRLLEVKNQLVKFDDYFNVEVTDSFTLHLKNPVIYDSDIMYLTELNPSRIEENQSHKEFIYQFVKVENPPSPGNKDLIFSMTFNEEKKLDSIVFSPVILQIVPARFLELSIRAVGNGKVDKLKRQLKGDVERVAQEGLEIPTYEKMIAVMGKPYQEVRKPDGLHTVFRYLLQTDSKGGKTEDRKKAVVDMLFDEKTKQLIKVSGNFAGMKISVNYSRLVKPDIQN
jgi:hypothetical protein